MLQSFCLPSGFCFEALGFAVCLQGEAEVAHTAPANSPGGRIQPGRVWSSRRYVAADGLGCSGKGSRLLSPAPFLPTTPRGEAILLPCTDFLLLRPRWDGVAGISWLPTGTGMADLRFVTKILKPHYSSATKRCWRARSLAGTLFSPSRQSCSSWTYLSLETLQWVICPLPGCRGCGKGFFFHPQRRAVPQR